jgi:uncharacterized protein YjbI with pentapeptide repeats
VRPAHNSPGQVLAYGLLSLLRKIAIMAGITLNRCPHSMNSKPRSLADVLSETPLKPLSAESLHSDQSYDSIVVRDADIKLSQNTGIFVENGLFEKTDMSQSKWRSFETDQVLFKNCTLANADWSAARHSRSEFQRTRLTGVIFADAILDDVVFSRCKLDLAAFHDAHLAGCRFENCDLREVDFQGATLKRVVFRNCDLRSARFPRVSLEELDLRGSQIAGMYIDATALRGTIVDPHQVADFAAMFGLAVEDLPAGES